MRRVEIALLCAACAAAVPALAQTYNGADTFVPGKKYTCVPTADHKGWDCNESGKSAQTKPTDSEPAQSVAPTQAESAQPLEPPSPSSQPSSRSTLPSYLTSAAANNPSRVEDAPSTVSAAAAHANAPAPVPQPTAPLSKPPARKAVTPSTRTVPLKPVTKSAVAATPPAPRPASKPVALRATHAPVVEAASGGGEFMTLPGDRFVVEMAHATSQRELDATRSAIRVPSGELYEVHLRQNGTDAWLLLWGSFDTLEAARSARNTMSASATLGWPRRIAPLQAEARRVSP